MGLLLLSTNTFSASNRYPLILWTIWLRSLVYSTLGAAFGAVLNPMITQ